MTRRLYHEDATLRRFDAEVIAHTIVGGQPAVVLQVLRALASQLSCGPSEVPLAMEKMRASSASATAEITALRSRLADAIVATLAGTGAVIAAIPGDVEALRSVAAKLANSGRDAILCAPDESGAAVVLFRAAGSSLDCGALWKKLAARASGRGGGKAERAEGRIGTPVGDWSALVAELLPISAS